MNTAADTCNSSPKFINQAGALPMPFVCLNQLNTYNYGVTELDGDSLVYTLVQGMTNGPNAFVAYTAPYTAASPITGMTIDPNTGTLTFTPNTAGEYVVAVQVCEYDSNQVLKGCVVRDIQFVAVQCSGAPVSGGIDSGGIGGGAIFLDSTTLFGCAGDSLKFSLIFTDPDTLDTLSIFTTATTVLPGSVVIIDTLAPDSLRVSVCWLVPQSPQPSYNVLFTVTDNGCPNPASSSIQVSINTASSTQAGPPVTICGNQTAQLSAIGGSTFTWSVISGDPIVPGVNFSSVTSQNPVAQPSITTKYKVVSNIANVCPNSNNAEDSVVVTVVPDFTLTATPDTAICLLDSIQMNVITSPSANYTYVWSPAFSLTDDSIQNPVAGMTFTTDYVVTVTSPVGCVKRDTASIVVTPPFPSLTAEATDSVVCPGSGSTIFANIGDTTSTAMCGPGAGLGCANGSFTFTIGTGTSSNASN
ncbi:MAG: hypothetical protein AAGB22_11695, partial [Bacteroidota bacterium]